MDCGLTYEGEPVSGVSGLSHLDGMTVSVLADGNVEPEQTVVNGQLKLSKVASASKITVGLSYSSELETLDVEVPNSSGAYQGTMKKVSSIKVRLLESRGGEFGPSFSRMDRFAEHKGTQTGACLPLWSGIEEIVLPFDWNSNGRVCIRQRDPLPMNVLAVLAEVRQGG